MSEIPSPPEKMPSPEQGPTPEQQFFDLTDQVASNESQILERTVGLDIWQRALDKEKVELGRATSMPEKRWQSVFERFEESTDPLDPDIKALGDAKTALSEYQIRGIGGYQVYKPGQIDLTEKVPEGVVTTKFSLEGDQVHQTSRLINPDARQAQDYPQLERDITSVNSDLNRIIEKQQELLAKPDDEIRVELKLDQ